MNNAVIKDIFKKGISGVAWHAPIRTCVRWALDMLLSTHYTVKSSSTRMKSGYLPIECLTHSAGECECDHDVH